MAKKASKRQLQVAELIRRNMGMLLQQEGIYIYGEEALVTVTNVRVSPDLLLAKIYLSIYNTEDKQSVLLLMEDKIHELQQGLARRIGKQIRRIPQLAIYEDETLDEMYRVDALFDKLEEENQMGRDRDDSEEEDEAEYID